VADAASTASKPKPAAPKLKNAAGLTTRGAAGAAGSAAFNRTRSRPGASLMSVRGRSFGESWWIFSAAGGGRGVPAQCRLWPVKSAAGVGQDRGADEARGRAEVLAAWPSIETAFNAEACDLGPEAAATVTGSAVTGERLGRTVRGRGTRGCFEVFFLTERGLHHVAVRSVAPDRPEPAAASAQSARTATSRQKENVSAQRPALAAASDGPSPVRKRVALPPSKLDAPTGQASGRPSETSSDGGKARPGSSLKQLRAVGQRVAAMESEIGQLRHTFAAFARDVNAQMGDLLRMVADVRRQAEA
jgi:hypothetical protein